MKKYKVTLEHGFLKPGFIEYPDNGFAEYSHINSQLAFLMEFIDDSHIYSWLKLGWIEEICGN